MPSGNFCPAGPLGSQCFGDECTRLQSHPLNVPGQAGKRDASTYSLSTVSEQLKQVDWKTTLEGSENAVDILDLSNEIAKRGAGLMAFRRKYYKILFDDVNMNRSGNLRGIVVSAKWRKYYSRLGKFGSVLSLAGIPLEAAELSWNDLSAKGISANVMTATARSATKSTLLAIPQIVQTGAQVTGWAAEGLGFREAANDINLFSSGLEDSINQFEKVIDRTLSVANSRDVLTWDRSVINPSNWSLLAEGVRGHFEDLASETQPLYDSVVRTVGGWFSDR